MSAALRATAHPRLSARVGGMAPSATLAVDATAKAMKAAGRDVIGFGAGEPDFSTPDHIVAAAERACREPRLHHYTPAGGLPELREAVAAKTARESGLQTSASQVLVTNGAKQAVFEAFATLLDPGDEVLLPAPYWTTYPEAIRLAGGVPVEVPTTPEGDYLVSVDQLEQFRTPRTKALLWCSPSNPSGAVAGAGLTREVGRWAVDTGTWVVTDEIYEHFVYGDVRMFSLPAETPDLGDQCVVVNGVAKTYAMTGWRVGWMIGPPDVVKAATNLQSHSTSNVCNVAQAAAVAALNGDLSSMAAMRAAFDRRRKTMHSMLAAIPGVTCPEPMGAFFCYPSLLDVLDRPIRGRTPKSTADLATIVLEEVEVAIVPGEAFGTPGYARLSYALSDDELAEGVSRLAAVLADAG
ncbi:MAG: pyridoxal phosphate-dependent aminotransferase [Frankiaceae bacterium]